MWWCSGSVNFLAVGVAIQLELPGISTCIRGMSVPLEVTRNSNNKEVFHEHENWPWDSIGGNVDFYVWRCKTVVRLCRLWRQINIEYYLISKQIINLKSLGNTGQLHTSSSCGNQILSSSVLGLGIMTLTLTESAFSVCLSRLNQDPYDHRQNIYVGC